MSKGDVLIPRFLPGRRERDDDGTTRDADIQLPLMLHFPLNIFQDPVKVQNKLDNAFESLFRNDAWTCKPR